MNSISCGAFESDYDCIMDGWEPKENDDGAIYFSSSHLKTTSWTHPYLDKIFEELSEYNEIRYAAYRTSLKLRHLQLKSGLSWITLRGIKRILFSRREPENNYRESMVSHKEAFTIIASILDASDNLRLHRMHFAKAAAVIVNLLIELYDTRYEGKFAFSSLKISLTALCSAQLIEKYRFFYSEIYNYDRHALERYRLLYLFYDLMQLVEVLKESTAFGTNISVAVDSCLNHNLAPAESGRSCEDSFYDWLSLEPQIIVWLPTLHRLAATENIYHYVQCSYCGINPIKGFRYRCLQCLRYDLCQICFYHGKVSLAHKSKHPMQEYCLQASKKDNTKAVFRILRNKLSKKHRSQSKITYLPLDDDSITGSVFQWQPRHQQSNPRDVFCGSNDSGLVSNPENDAAACLDSPERDAETVKIPPNHNIDAKTLDLEQLSKKDMFEQQCRMAKKIEELQDENKYLYEKLLAQRKTSDVGTLDSSNSETCIPTNETFNLKQEEEPISEDHLILKTEDMQVKEGEDSSPIIISAIEYESHDERSSRNEIDSGKDEVEEDALPNVMDIVGYYTPVRPVSSEDQQELNDQPEYGKTKIPEEKKEDTQSSTEAHVEKASIQPLTLAYEGIAVKNDNTEVVSVALAERDDLTSESTASEGLEYGYSDMSLPTESLSQTAVLKDNGTLPLHSDANFVEQDIFSRSQKIRISNVSSNEMRESEMNNGAMEMTQRNAYDINTPAAKMGSSEVYTPAQFQSVEMNTNELFLNISDIMAEGSALPILVDSSNKPVTPRYEQAPERRLTLEPVFMSTPLVTGGEQQSSKTTSRNGKENCIPVRKSQDGTLHLVASYKCKAQTPGITPRSALTSRQVKRLMSSREDLSIDGRSATVDLSQRDVGMTTMFDKAERLGGLEATDMGESLAHGDKEEMEKIMQKFETAGNTSRDQMKPDNSSSSMLNAVLNVGDAMADLVKATAELKQK